MTERNPYMDAFVRGKVAAEDAENRKREEKAQADAASQALDRSRIAWLHEVALPAFHPLAGPFNSFGYESELTVIADTAGIMKERRAIEFLAWKKGESKPLSVSSTVSLSIIHGNDVRMFRAGSILYDLGPFDKVYTSDIIDVLSKFVEKFSNELRNAEFERENAKR